MTQNGPGVSASDLIALRAESLALPILLSGVLDAKIEELKAAEEKTSAAINDAAQQVADAKAASAKVDADRASLDKDIADFESAKKVAADNAAALKASLDGRQKSVAGQEATVRDAQAKLKADQQAFNDRLQALKLPV